MKHLDIETWERKDHFTFFQSRRNPCLCVTSTVDVKHLLQHRNDTASSKHRLTDYLYFAAMRSANTVPEFRMRIVDKQPVIFSTVDAAFTYTGSHSTLHSNCIAKYDDEFQPFSKHIQSARDHADEHPTLTPAGGESQALIYLTCLRDIHFTSLSNPWDDPWIDSVPRIALGKIDMNSHTMPISIEALHSFIDGKHLTSFLICLSSILDNPSESFAN